MAWALHAAARSLSRKQIEHEILNSRDLSKKGPPLRRLAYAMADREQGDRLLRAITDNLHYGEPPVLKGSSASRSESFFIEEVLRHLVEST